MTTQVKGKVAIVTGASSGIGHSIAIRLVNEGGKVVIADVNEEAGKKIAIEFNTNKLENVAIFHKTDVSKWDELISLFDKTKETFGRIDIVINNAGITEFQNGMLKDSLEEPTLLSKVVEVNLMGVIYGTKLAFQYLKQNNPQGGVIINTASIAAIHPMFSHGAYSASKAGVVGLTRAMADISQLFNITVNAVCPSTTKSGLTASVVGLIPDRWWSSVDDVVEAYFRCIYNSKINGTIFSVSNKGIKEESFSEPPSDIEEILQVDRQYYLTSQEEEKKKKVELK
ncbi:hypothetical protein C1645_808124 [Glomus cerebriforme]|uniref:15-hydroxyprostaglandin dehydrogenase n=1 Tax=Glomus cerebriforme TaxID=658196 RepID=A0A397SLH7_9GLOM|nr:hypothetical protein C1645_808124 [Glomus cerebriforme]